MFKLFKTKEYTNEELLSALTGKVDSFWLDRFRDWDYS
jgi:hypothetical protein